MTWVGSLVSRFRWSSPQTQLRSVGSWQEAREPESIQRDPVHARAQHLQYLRDTAFTAIIRDALSEDGWVARLGVSSSNLLCSAWQRINLSTTFQFLSDATHCSRHYIYSPQHFQELRSSTTNRWTLLDHRISSRQTKVPCTQLWCCLPAWTNHNSYHSVSQAIFEEFYL